MHCFSEQFESAILPLFDMLPMGVLLLGRGGNVLAANRIAKQTLDHGGPIGESGGAVVLNSATQNQKLRQLLDLARSGNRSRAALRVPRRSNKPLLMLFIPLRNDSGTDQEDRPLALLILSATVHRPDPALLTSFFGFTPGEARVASLLMQGKTVMDVAASLEISENTIRNHLKHMYTKTGTRKQSELLHLLLSSPASLLVSWSVPEEAAQPAPLHRTRAASS